MNNNSYDLMKSASGIMLNTLQALVSFPVYHLLRNPDCLLPTGNRGVCGGETA